MFFTNPLVVVILLVILLSTTLFIIPRRRTCVVRQFNGFLGIRFTNVRVHVPFISHVTVGAGVHIGRLGIRLRAGALSGIFIAIITSARFHIGPGSITATCCRLHSPTNRLHSCVRSTLHSTVPTLSLSSTFTHGSSITFSIRGAINTRVDHFNFAIIGALVATVSPDPRIGGTVSSVGTTRHRGRTAHRHTRTRHVRVRARTTTSTRGAHLRNRNRTGCHHRVTGNVISRVGDLRTINVGVGSIGGIILFGRCLSIVHSLSRSGGAGAIILPTSAPNNCRSLCRRIAGTVLATSRAGWSPHLQVPVRQ